MRQNTMFRHFRLSVARQKVKTDNMKKIMTRPRRDTTLSCGNYALASNDGGITAVFVPGFLYLGPNSSATNTTCEINVRNRP